MRQFKVAAERGHTRARFELAVCYKNGFGVQQDYAEALKQFRVITKADAGMGLGAATAVVAESQLQLGLLYKEGKVLKKSNFWSWGRTAAVSDATQAFQWFQRAAWLGNAEAQVELGVCFYFGCGINQELKQAYHLFLSAHETDNNLGSALFWLAECLRCGIGVEKNLSGAVKLYKTAAANGHDLAQLHLDYCFEQDIGVQREIGFVEALQWATESKTAEAQFELGLCYFHGLSTRQQPSEAVRLFLLAAASNLATAQYWLGYCYWGGYGVDADSKEAVRYFMLAADQGNDRAQKCLGDCYFFGIGVEQSYTEAIRLFQLGEQQNNLQCLTNLGDCYCFEWGVTQDFGEAVRYYQLSIAKGDGTGGPHIRLGWCYQHGHGVTKDLSEALSLYRQAACFGHNDAPAKVAELEAVLE